MRLFDPGDVVGVFRGFSASGMEFHADLVLPYRDELQSIPMHGQFVLVQLEHEDEAVLGRITAIAAEGRLVSPIGEDYAIRAMRDDRPIPDELRDQYLKYKVDIRVLGVVRLAGDKLIFVPSHRRLPHVGAKVALCSPEVLREVANAAPTSPIDTAAAEIGFLAFGEFVYAGDDPRGQPEDWMVVLYPPILPRFQTAQLVSRRTFVFARAGFGKSNLIKLLFSRLYAGDPVLPSRNGPSSSRHHHFRPRRRVLLARFQRPSRTGRCSRSDRTNGGFHLTAAAESGLRVLRRGLGEARHPPALGAAGDRHRAPGRPPGPAERHQAQVARPRPLEPTRRPDRHAPLPDQTRPRSAACAVSQPANEELQTNAIIANMTRVVDALHDPSSQLLRALMTALRAGKLCVVDISQLRGQRGLQLASIILAEIFAHNQREFTKAIPHNVPCIAVIEEAQAVLGPAVGRSGSAAAEDSPFVSWVKEGRKYGLGAVLVTQQPGSIPAELLSQGDNFFVFHLLSAGDLAALKRANAHFSDDLLATLLNEPLVGHGIFWSSAAGTDRGARPYPLPIRVLSFEAENRILRDPAYNGDAVDCYASRLRATFRSALAAAGASPGSVSQSPGRDTRPVARSGIDPVLEELAADAAAAAPGPTDVEAAYRAAAIDALRSRPEFRRYLSSAEGLAWGRVQAWLAQAAPPEAVVGNRFEWARPVVLPALIAILGPQGSAWRTESRPRPDRPGSSQTWIHLTETAESPDQATPPED